MVLIQCRLGAKYSSAANAIRTAIVDTIATKPSRLRENAETASFLRFRLVMFNNSPLTRNATAITARMAGSTSTSLMGRNYWQDLMTRHCHRTYLRDEQDERTGPQRSLPLRRCPRIKTALIKACSIHRFRGFRPSVRKSRRGT